MLLGRRQQLRYPRCKVFCKYVEFAPKLMSAGKVDYDLDKMIEQLDFVKRKIVYYIIELSIDIIQIVTNMKNLRDSRFSRSFRG